MHTTAKPPKTPPPAPYYVKPLNGGPTEEFATQWDALRYAYCKYGMAKFRLMTEAEYLTQP